MLGSWLILRWALKQMDPNRSAKQTAKERRKQLEKRLGRAVKLDGAYEDVSRGGKGGMLQGRSRGPAQPPLFAGIVGRGRYGQESVRAGRAWQPGLADAAGTGEAGAQPLQAWPRPRPAPLPPGWRPAGGGPGGDQPGLHRRVAG